MKKIALILCFVLCFSTLVCEAKPYTPPFTEHIIGDRVDRNMPESFSVESAEKALLAQNDFGGNIQSLTSGYNIGGWVEENGMLKIVKTDNTEVAERVFHYRGTIVAGDYYLFSCRVKEESLTGKTARNVLSAYNGSSTWLKEAGEYRGTVEADEDGFYNVFQVLQVPANTDRLRLIARVDDATTGTVYFDDFKLYHILIDPLETVLVKPGYKGLIYGDGVSDISMDIRIKETTGFYELANMALSVVFTDAEDTVIYRSDTDEPKAEMNISFSSKGLEEGTYYLVARLTDKVSGRVLSTKERTIRKVSASYRPDFYVDENGHTVRNGEKTFLKRIYDSGSGYTRLAESIAGTAVDVAAPNGMGWWFTPNNADAEAALSLLREENKTISLALMGYWWGNLAADVNEAQYLFRQQRDIRTLFTKVVADHKDEPALDSYYLFDEPDAILYGEEIRWNHDILSDLDLDHPTYGITDDRFGEYGLYTKMTDIIGIDPYPVGGKDTDDIARIGRSVREMVESFPNRPVYLCLQGFNWRKKYGENSRGPNYAELRNMAYQAICEGADGLDCYSYHEMLKDPSGKTFDEWWSELTAVYSDVEQYENIILSDEPAPAYSVSGGGEWLNITTRRYNGKSYIFAVNNTKSNQTASVKLSGAQAAKTDRDDVLSYGPNGYQLSFEPLEVKILTVTQDDYASPEAELKSMGFFNCSKIYPVVKRDTAVLQVTDDSMVINYHAAISDGAKLYINGAIKPLSGKISIKHADSFTVTVVAEDGKAKTTTQYVIDKQQ